jgi:hypothetical protein
MTKCKDRLWQEQHAEWYPQPVAAGPNGEGNSTKDKETSMNRLASKRWRAGPKSSRAVPPITRP